MFLFFLTEYNLHYTTSKLNDKFCNGNEKEHIKLYKL